MDPDPLPYIILALGPLLFALFTASEIAVASVNRVKLESLGKSHPNQVRMVMRLIDNAPHLLLTTALMRSVGVLMTAGATVYLFSAQINGWLLCLILFLIWSLMSIMRAFVRAKVLLHPEKYALQFASFTQLVTTLLRPFTNLLRGIYQSMLGDQHETLFEDILLSQNGLRLLIDAQKEENHIEEPEKQMIASILDLDDTSVREVMVPRIDMHTLSLDTKLTNALDVIIDAGHSRIPVYDDNIDHIVGVLYAKDLLHCFRDKRRDAHLQELLRPAHFIPASKKINTLFREMQVDKVHIAIIVDEYGGTAGLVTIEDLLEEIVGEIQDEYDADEELLAQLIKPDTYLISSRMSVDDFVELLGIETDEKDVDTVGGLIYVLSGHVPAQGEMLEYGGWRFTVLSVTGHRIDQVRAEKMVNFSLSAIEMPTDMTSQSKSLLNYR